MMFFVTLLLGGIATADDKPPLLIANLKGFQEVPSVSTVAEGKLRAVIVDDNRIDYDLTYSGLQGAVTQAHIHIAQRSVNGGIVLWFCGTSPSNLGPTGTPTCTAGSGHFTGSFTAANVQAITGTNVSQQVNAGDFTKVLAAIKGGVAYANVHTALSTGGEIRGQIKVTRDNQDKGKDH